MNHILGSLFEALNSDPFLNFLEELSEHDKLIADRELMGGGMHQICRGGKLDIHSDFNYHYKTKTKTVTKTRTKIKTWTESRIKTQTRTKIKTKI